MDMSAVFTSAVVAAAVSSIFTLVSQSFERKVRRQEAIFKAATDLTVHFLELRLRHRSPGKTLAIPPHEWVVYEFYRNFEHLIKHGKLPPDAQEKLDKWLKEEGTEQ